METNNNAKIKLGSSANIINDRIEEVKEVVDCSLGKKLIIYIQRTWSSKSLYQC